MKFSSHYKCPVHTILQVSDTFFFAVVPGNTTWPKKSKIFKVSGEKLIFFSNFHRKNTYLEKKKIDIIEK